MKKIFCNIFLILIVLGVMFSSVAIAGEKEESPAVGRIVINIDGLRNNKGVVGIALFNSDKGFPNDPDKAFKTAKASIKDKKASFVFEDVPYGEYAISVFHDENSNGKMGRTAFGKPTEGYGASKNPPKRKRPPKFSEAKFKFDKEKVEQVINLIYW